MSAVTAQHPPTPKPASARDAGAAGPPEAEPATAPSLLQTDGNVPIIEGFDLRTIAVIGIFVLATIAALYVAKTLLMPVVAAFVLGTMLAPAATWLQRYKVPRPLGAVVIVLGVFGMFLLILGLITSPILEWSSRLPELAAILKQRAAVFDRPLAMLNDIRVYFGGSVDGQMQWPKIEWMQPTLGFLSPTIAELLLFFATLVLFIASWRDLRRTLVLGFPEHERRLLTLRMLNAIEDSLGGYLLTVTMINIGLGVVTGLICALGGMPNAAGLGALAAALNFIPIIGPIATFIALLAVGVISFPDVYTGVIPALAFAVCAFMEGHFITPAIVGRRLALNALAVFVAIAFWTWLWGPIGAFLSSPLLIVLLIVKQHMLPDDDRPFPDL